MCLWKVDIPPQSKPGNQLSSRFDLWCMELSSSFCAEIGVPLDLRRVSQENSGIAYRKSSHLSCMMWKFGWLSSQFSGIGLHVELILVTPSYFTFLQWRQCPSRLVTVLGESLELHQTNQSSLRIWLGTRNCSAHNSGEYSLTSWRGGSLIVLLELWREPGVYSQVTAGMIL